MTKTEYYVPNTTARQLLTNFNATTNHAFINDMSVLTVKGLLVQSTMLSSGRRSEFNRRQN